MKIIRDGKLVIIDELIVAAKERLAQGLYVISNVDPIEHIAAYVAWREVGGVILVDNPMLPPSQIEEIHNTAKALDYGSQLILTTSGTTGTPTPYSYGIDHVHRSSKHFVDLFEVTPDTNFLNILPPTMAIFWHLVLGPWYDQGSTLTLSSVQTIGKDIAGGSDVAFLPPAMIDRLPHIPNASLDNYRLVITGGSVVGQRHARTVLEMGADQLLACYAATEVCRMMLYNRVTVWEDYDEWFDLSTMPRDITPTFNELGELVITCSALPNNFTGDVMNMRDIFERDGNRVRFKGRSRELCKVNGNTISLFEVEDTITKITGIKDCLVRVEQRGLVQYLTCVYEGDVPDGYNFKAALHDTLARFEIPLKFTKGTLERTGMGKKVRRI